MRFSYSLLQEYLTKKLPAPEKIAELLTMHSFEVEEIKKVGSDYVLTIDILPNRAHDCLGHLGVAREIGALLGMQLEENLSSAKLAKGNIDAFLDARIEDNEFCLRHTAAIMTNIEVGPSPKFIQDRLVACGMRPINNVVDIANYVMLETGQPLHAFDFDKLSHGDNNLKERVIGKPKELIIRRAKKGEKITTLDGVSYELDNEVLVIADSEGPLDIAGIKGGKRAEITNSTTTLILESANFLACSIRYSSKKLGISTDASYRFERGVPMSFAPLALARFVELLEKYAGGKFEGSLDSLQKPLPKRVAQLRKEKLDSLVGMQIDLTKAGSILTSLGFIIEKEDARGLHVAIPDFRQDVESENDLIEEVARVMGYENIPAKPPIAELVAPETNEQYMSEKILRRMLMSLGYSDMYGYSFISEQQKKIWGYEKLVDLENPLSAEFQYMRPSLFPGLAQGAHDNLRFFPVVELYEIGTVFEMEKGLNAKGVGRTGQGPVLAPAEKSVLGLMRADRKKTNDTFYAAKGAVERIIQSLGLTDIAFEENCKDETLHPTRRAEIKSDEKVIGYMGELAPSIAGALGIEGSCVVCELDIALLFAQADEERAYTAPIAYPAIVRDVALMVPSDTRVDQIIQKIYTAEKDSAMLDPEAKGKKGAGGSLIQNVELFDMYEQKETGEGKKSVAFHIVFQSPVRTLSNKEVDEMMERITWQLNQEEMWEVRA